MLQLAAQPQLQLAVRHAPLLAVQPLFLLILRLDLLPNHPVNLNLHPFRLPLHQLAAQQIPQLLLRLDLLPRPLVNLRSVRLVSHRLPSP